MIISLIVAMDENGGIGYKGKLPWHLSSDLKRFKALTTGHHILMGRKTFEAIGQPLPGRVNMVLTRSASFVAPGCVVIHSLEEGISWAEHAGETELFVIGGGEIFKLAIPLASILYLTVVKTTISADTFFPRFDPAEWQEIERVEIPADEKNDFPSCFRVLKRRICSVWK